MTHARLWTLLGAAFFALAPVAGQACEALVKGPRGVVTSVSDGDTVSLADGRVIRLIGTQAPKLPLGREDFETWPLADASRDALVALTMGQEVELRYGGERIDRHGRSLGQLFVIADPEVWVQGEMIATGMARVYSFPDNRACLSDLLAREATARANALGVWAGDPYYSIRRAERPAVLEQRAGHYELVEGRVLKAERSGGRTYLNFGRIWKEDFTVVIDRVALKSFGETDPLGLEGALIRVRGWVDVRDGPRVEVTHPEQIEVLARR